MRTKPDINTELRAVCRYRGLAISRWMLILLLLPFSHLLNVTPLYLSTAFLLFPAIINYAFRSAHPERDQRYLEQAVLSETMKACRFTYHKYRSEIVCSFLIVFLLAFWQLFGPRILWHGLPVWRLPAFFLIVYYIAGRGITMYCRIKIHYDFMHLNI